MRGQHQWWTVSGGSIEYVRRLERSLTARGVRLRVGTPVAAITRNGLQPAVHVTGEAPVAYDQVILASHSDVALRLLTQPRMLGFRFDPVSFWLAFKGEALVAAIAEVNNTFGDRHSYFCALPGFAPLGPDTETAAEKMLHVSPFQEVAGGYSFRFGIDADHVNIGIVHQAGDAGLVATLTGQRRPASTLGLPGAVLRRPLGPGRVLALIHWQALKLWLKGAHYRRRPAPPSEEVS